ncbi:MAG: hypothetical protein F6K11_18225 [Leptolyngbya sp. SIO3F4]|nr:hypothetical protein [Leptolyngbya sp. SIO3F4]
MTVYSIPPGSYLGRGIDIELGENYGEALEFQPAQQIGSDNLGQKVEFRLTQITNNAELTKSLNVTASASLGLGLFSGSAEAKYTSQQQINRYSTYLLISVIVQNPDKIIRSPRLKSEAFKLLQTKGWETFEQSYGPQYLAGIRSGGSYHGLIEISTSSKQEQQEIAVAVSASYAGFKAEGKLNHRLIQAIENKSLKVTILQSGGSGDSLEVSLEEMIKQAQNFPAVVKQHPVIFQGLFEEYRKTVPLPPGIGEGPTARRHRQDVINELAHKYLKCKDYRADLRYVLDNFATFEDHLNFTPVERRAKIARYEQDFRGVSQQLNDIERLARTCRNSNDQCQLPTRYFTPTETLPTFDGENLMLKKMEQELATLRQQLNALRSSISTSSLSVSRSANLKDTEIAGSLKLSKQGTLMYHQTNEFGHPTGDGFRMRYDNHFLGQNADALVIEKTDGNNTTAPDGSIVFANTAKNGVVNPSLIIRGNGNVGIGTKHPKAKLDVQGEIRGKLWYSAKLTWRQGQAPVRLGHSSKGFPIITRVQGAFKGGGEWIDTYIHTDGYWYLRGQSKQSGLFAQAIFVGRP